MESSGKLLILIGSYNVVDNIVERCWGLFTGNSSNTTGERQGQRQISIKGQKSSVGHLSRTMAGWGPFLCNVLIEKAIVCKLFSIC